MANEKNLKPNSERTPTELREMTRKAGIASGIARRNKKTAREFAEAALNAEVTDKASGKKVVVKDAIIQGLVAKAVQEKDLNTVKYLFELIGEGAAQKVDVTTNGKDVGTQIVFSPTPLSERDIQEIKEIQNGGNKEDSDNAGISET